MVGIDRSIECARVGGVRAGVLRGRGGRARVSTQRIEGGGARTPLLGCLHARARCTRGWKEGAEKGRMGSGDAGRGQGCVGVRRRADRAFVVCAPCK